MIIPIASYKTDLKKLAMLSKHASSPTPKVRTQVKLLSNLILMRLLKKPSLILMKLMLKVYNTRSELLLTGRQVELCPKEILKTQPFLPEEFILLMLPMELLS